MKTTTPTIRHDNNPDHSVNSSEKMDWAADSLPLDAAAFDKFCRESESDSRIVYKTGRVLLGSEW